MADSDSNPTLPLSEITAALRSDPEMMLPQKYRLLAQLDPQDLNVVARVLTLDPPDFSGGVPCPNAPACVGHLVLSEAQYEAAEELGQVPILLHDGRKGHSPVERSIVYFPPPSEQDEQRGFKMWQAYHELINVVIERNSTLTVDPARSDLHVDFEDETLSFISSTGTKVSIESGEVVTIDPPSGRLWVGKKDIGSAAPDVPEAKLALKDAAKHLPEPRLAPRFEFGSHTAAILDFMPRYPERSLMRIGLYTTEGSFGAFHQIRGDDHIRQIFEHLATGLHPLKGLVGASLDALRWVSVNYRLTDPRCLPLELLPIDVRARFEREEMEVPNTPASRFCANFADSQIEDFLTDIGHSQRAVGKKKNLICPMVRSTELFVQRRVVFDEARERLVHPAIRPALGFGAMIETREALAQVEELSVASDALIVGFGDLTAELTGLKREELDHRGWMAERGYAGNSPFERLVPDVLDPVREAVVRAKEVNPSVQIGVAGAQLADFASIEAAAGLPHIDWVIVPPAPSALLLGQLVMVNRAVARMNAPLPG